MPAIRTIVKIYWKGDSARQRRISFWRRARAIVSALLAQVLQIFLPFQRQQILLLIVALLTTGHDVGFGRFASPDQRDDVIHGQLSGGKSPLAVMAKAGSASIFPPLRAAELASPISFALDLFFRYRQKMKFFHGRGDSDFGISGLQAAGKTGPGEIARGAAALEGSL